MGQKENLGRKMLVKKNLSKKVVLVKIYFGQTKFWD